MSGDGVTTPDTRVAALIAQARRDPRFAQRLLTALTVNVNGDPSVVGWLGLFVAVRVERAA